MQRLINWIVLDLLPNPAALVPMVIGVLSLMLSTINTFKKVHHPIVRERYDKVYAPLFDIVELFMYMKSETPTEATYEILEVVDIISKNKHICGGRLLSYRRSLLNPPKSDKDYQELIDALVKHIDFEYDVLARELKIPIRTIMHRLNCYRKKFWKDAFIYMCLFSISSVILLVLASTVLLLGLSIQYLIFFSEKISTLPANTQVLLSVLGFFFIILAVITYWRWIQTIRAKN